MELKGVSGVVECLREEAFYGYRKGIKIIVSNDDCSKWEEVEAPKLGESYLVAWVMFHGRAHLLATFDNQKLRYWSE